MKIGLVRMLVVMGLMAVLTACGGGGGTSGGGTTTYTVSYDANGATSGTAPASASYAESDTVSVSGNTGNLARASFSFVGWNSAADGSGTDYAANTTFSMAAADITLFAQWSADPTYSVSYNANGATGGSVPGSASYFESATVTVASNSGGLALGGYTFNGWNTAANGSGTSYASGDTFVMGTAAVTLYAQWAVIAPPTYSVSYNANGATSGSVPGSASYLQGATVTVASNSGTLALSGYSFNGWNTAANGSGTSYAPGVTFTMGTAAVTLYAQWTVLPTYTVSYIANGATSGRVPDSSSYLQGATVTVSGNTGGLNRSGYTFSGWNTAANGSGTSYAPSTTFTMGTSAVTLYAQWTALPTYSVSYNANGATSGSVPGSSSYLQGATVTVSGNTGSLNRSGYAFSGWNTAANGSGTSYAPSTTFTMGTSAVTLYAQWTALPTYSVSYNANGATSGLVPISSSYLQGATVTVASNSGILALSGYTFNGWNTAANGSGASYAPGVTFTMGTAAVTLYAQWSPLPTSTLSYNGNSATGGTVPAPSTHYEYYDVTVKDNTGHLYKTDHDFDGWNTAANGSGTRYVSGDRFTLGTADSVLYAQWTPKPTYTVTYNGNGSTSGTLPVDSTNYLERQVVTIPVTSIYRTNYRFMGWNTQADGSGITYYPGNIFAIGNTNVTLYARWALTASPTITAIDYMNVLGESGGSPSYGSAYFEDGTYAIALENTGGLTRPGYSFDGWSTEYRDGAAGMLYKPGDIIPVSLSAFKYLYPHWTANTTYTVTYNGNGNDGGTVPVDTMNYENGTYARVKGNTGNLVKAGYQFRGWNTYANGAGMLYNAPQMMAMTSAKTNVTLYAWWTMNPTYTVTYANTGATSGVPPVDTAHYEQGQSVSVFGNFSGMINTTGYPTTNNTKVMGWSRSSGGYYTAGGSFNMGGVDLVMTPNWGPPLETIMFKAGTSNGNLGGYYGAVATCRNAVPTESNCSERPKIGAFMSAVNSSPNPGDFIAWNTGVNRYAKIVGPTGIPISTTWAGLFDGGIDNSLQTAGVLPTNTTWWSGMYADTATSARGETACYYDKNWSSGASGVAARAGSSSIKTADWLGSASAYAICSNVRYIICTCSE